MRQYGRLLKHKVMRKQKVRDRTERAFEPVYLMGMGLILILLGALLIFLILLYNQNTQPNLKSVVQAIQNITPTNISALIQPTCLLYQYDVPYICGAHHDATLFANYEGGIYTSIMMIYNPNIIDVTYSKFITSSVPYNLWNNTASNLVLTSKFSAAVYNCSDPMNIFMSDVSDGGDGKRDDNDYGSIDADNNEFDERDDRLYKNNDPIDGEEEVEGYSHFIAKHGHHMHNLNKIKEKIEQHDERNSQFERVPASFYAGVFSVTSPYTLSVWITQGVINVTNNVPDVEIIPATVNCITFST